MVSVFGDRPSTIGPRGPAGPPGSAFNLMKWCPGHALKMFRETESSLFYFDTEDDGITKDKALKNRAVPVKNATLIKPFRPGTIKKNEKTGKYYIEMKYSTYKINLNLGEGFGNNIIFIFSLKSLDHHPGEHFIFSNHAKTRAASLYNEDAKKAILEIHGTDYHHQIPHKPGGWVTLLIQYCSSKTGTDVRYIFNGTPGEFYAGANMQQTDGNLYIGAHPEEGELGSWTTDMGSFETYYIDSPDFLPLEMCKILLSDITGRITSSENTRGYCII